MGKSRAKRPAYSRRSIQNAVAQRLGAGKSKKVVLLNREAIGWVVQRCAVAAAHDILQLGQCDVAVLTLKMNNAISRYILDRNRYGEPMARKLLEKATAHLMPEEFLLPAGKLPRTKREFETFAEWRDTAKIEIRFFVVAAEEMGFTPEQIEAVKRGTKEKYQLFLSWAEESGSEKVAYERLNKTIEDIYGMGAMPERTDGLGPIFGKAV